MVDNQLQTRQEELQGQAHSTRLQLEQTHSELKRGGQSGADAIQLSYRADQLKINLKALEEQLKIIQSQIDALTIVARRDAIVSSWDARNQLSGRPVGPGQLLLTTYQPQSPWQLQLSIPERHLGRLRSAMNQSREGLRVQFSLSSHPSEVRHGRLVKLSDQLIKDDDGSTKALGIVALDADSLPTKSEGALARATIGCGRTYAGWLAIRDAYREASAWWRLNW